MCTSPSVPVPQRRLTRTALLACLVLAGLAVTPLTAASPASAAQCQISPGLQEPAAKAGITCGDATDTSSNGPSPSAPTNDTECNYGNSLDAFPEGFLDFMKDDHLDRFVRTPKGEYVIRTYYEKETGRTTGQYEIGAEYADHSYTEFVTNSTLVIDGHTVDQMAGFNCKRSRDGWTFTVTESQMQGDGNSTTPAAPSFPAASSDIRNPITVTDAIVALPGHPNEYLLRLNLTNTASTEAPYVDAAFDLTRWGRAEIVSGPATCDVDTAFQSCHLEALPAGTTSTLVFHVTATATADAYIPVSISNQGRRKLSWSAADAPTMKEAPVQNTFFVTIPD